MVRGKPLAERPAPPPLAALRWRLGVVPGWLVVLAALVLVLTSLEVDHQGSLTALDHAVSRGVRRLGIHHRFWLEVLIYPLTFFGQRLPVLLVTIPTVAYLVWRARSIDALARYAAALIALTASVYGLKDGLHRTAPPVDLVHTGVGNSFPSGHLANAVLVWGLVWWCAYELDPISRFTRTLRAIQFAGPCCVVIGMTLLDYHWISDFIAGACVGTILLAGVTTPGWSRATAPIDRRIWRTSVAPG